MPERARVLLVGTGSVAAAAEALLVDIAQVVRGDAADIESGARVDIALIALDRPSPDTAEQLDRACHARGVPWCGATLLAHIAEIGPMVVPGQTPCHDCWRRRRLAHADDPLLARLIARVASRSRGPWFAGELPVLITEAAALAVYEALALVHGRDAPPPKGMGDFWYLDGLDGEARRHLFSSVGHCPRCRGQPVRQHAAVSERARSGPTTS